jgi:hypothetical protein
VLGQAPAPDSSIVSTPNLPSGSTGGIKSSQAADDTFFEILFSGGPLGVGIMIALILMSILAMYLVIDQWLTLRRKDLMPNDLNENVRQLLSPTKLAAASPVRCPMYWPAGSPRSSTVGLRSKNRSRTP